MSETLQVAHVNSYVEAVHNLGDIDAEKHPDSHVAILRGCIIKATVFPRVSIRTVTAMLRDRARAMPQTESVGPEILFVLWELCETKGSTR